jgi:hypothetical protein
VPSRPGIDAGTISSGNPIGFVARFASSPLSQVFAQRR